MCRHRTGRKTYYQKIRHKISYNLGRLGKCCHMHTIKKYIISLVIMCLVSILMLMVVSLLAYVYKWQADKALIGITVTYILAGFLGGFGLKRMSETKDMTKKLVEGILLGVFFMMLLLLFSIIFTDNEFEISSRLLLIWMLLTGSTSLGRIL